MSESLTIKQENFCQTYINTKEFFISKLTSGIEFPVGYGDKYYVYLLINPLDDQIFYIGKGKKNRAEHHLKENKRGTLSNYRKHSIINEIVKSGEEPLIVVFANNLNETKALALEKLLIGRFKKHITNKSSGQVDRHLNNKTWAQNTLRRCVPYESWIKDHQHLPDKIKDTYKLVYSEIERIARGELKIYNTIESIQVNGKKVIRLR